MSTPFLGQLQLFAFGYAPKGWAMCAGQTLAINQNQALFSLLGITFGGDGRTTFQLPDLRGRAAIAFSSAYVMGQSGGQETHTLTIAEVPSHVHTFSGTSNAASVSTAAGNVLAKTAGSLTVYSAAAPTQTSLNPASVTSVGSSQAHENRAPYLAMTWCIALQGIFPSRN
jgi:microcystin-dependent protein